MKKKIDAIRKEEREKVIKEIEKIGTYKQVDSGHIDLYSGKQKTKTQPKTARELKSEILTKLRDRKE